MSMNYDTMMGGHALWWVFWIAVVIALLFWVQRGYPGHPKPPPETPHEVLRRRLANGEISTDEYEQRKTILERNG